MLFCRDCRYYGKGRCSGIEPSYSLEACQGFYENPTAFRRRNVRIKQDKSRHEYRREKICTKDYAERWVSRMCESFTEHFSTVLSNGESVKPNIEKLYQMAVCNIYKTTTFMNKHKHPFTLYVKRGFMRLTNVETGKTVSAQLGLGDMFDEHTGIAILWARYRNKPVPKYLLTDRSESQKEHEEPADCVRTVNCEIIYSPTEYTNDKKVSFICPECGYTATVMAYRTKQYTQEHKFCCKCGVKFRYNKNLLHVN